MSKIDVTYYGHSCFEVVIHNKKLLFDPFISYNPLAKSIDMSTIKPDYILVSHGHNDHIADCVQIAKQSGAKVIACYEIISWLEKQGIENVHPMNVGGKWSFDFGNVKCVAAAHSSSLPDGSYGGVALGFVVESNEGNFYYAGDTALTYDMKLIGDYREIDFAFLPIGDNFTMSVDNALIATDFIKCKNIIGMHYDTFAFIKIDKEAAIQKFKSAGKNLTLFNIEETKQIQTK
jgi:L-ascorbate metabolism protein UlaG (beta-lactamase superfamily)